MGKMGRPPEEIRKELLEAKDAQQLLNQRIAALSEELTNATLKGWVVFCSEVFPLGEGLVREDEFTFSWDPETETLHVTWSGVGGYGISAECGERNIRQGESCWVTSEAKLFGFFATREEAESAAAAF